MVSETDPSTQMGGTWGMIPSLCYGIINNVLPRRRFSGAAVLQAPRISLTRKLGKGIAGESEEYYGNEMNLMIKLLN